MDKIENKKIKTQVSSQIMKKFILVMIAMILIFCGISFLLAKINTESNSYNDMLNAGNVISGIVSDYMDPKISSVKSVSENKDVIAFLNEIGSSSSEEDITSADKYITVQSLLNNITAYDRSIVSSWIVSESGGAVIGNENKFITAEDFSLSSKYWYRGIGINDNSIICSAATESIFNSSVNVISIIAPIYSDGTAIGFVGSEVTTSGLNKVLGQYTLNSGCYPVITCDYGTIIYSPSSDDFRSRFNVNQVPLSNILIQSSSYADGIDSFTTGLNKSTYYYIDNNAIPNWSVIVLFDSHILSGGIFSFFGLEIIILICVVVLIAIVLRNMLIKEVGLLSKIKDSTQELSTGNYKYTIDTSYAGNNELKVISDNLNSIANSLNEKNELIVQYTSTDTLTGLPNRISLYKHLETLITSNLSKDITEKKRFALMFVDIDNFKWLNETLGHNFGDAVLCTFANVLSDALRKYGSIYRFSGDEFIIIVEFGSEYSIIHDVIDRMQKAFDKPIKVLTDNIYLRFSVGVSIYPDDDEVADLLLRDADLALHRSKDSGKDRVSFYTNSIKKKRSFSKAAIAQLISTALKENEMYLNYQPIISTESCDIHGFEVLLRWNNPELGSIPPTEFISVAEETGAIVQIGTWIFESACRFLKELCEKYRNDIIMSINVSPVQLRRADYLEHVKRVIEITQVNPANIQIEITESTLIDFIDSDNSVIEQINDMGIAIALDDFGTGYSSLNYLKNFPIKCLKIDKSFVDEINNNKRDYAITDSIIDLVHNLGIKTVAEGIETVGQYDFLREMKCDYIQGFLMSKPLNEDDALEFVEMYDALHKPDSRILKEHEKQLANEREEREKNRSYDEGLLHSDNNLVDTVMSK